VSGAIELFSISAIREKIGEQNFCDCLEQKFIRIRTGETGGPKPF